MKEEMEELLVENISDQDVSHATSEQASVSNL